MAYSPIKVLPEPVGALTTTEWPWFKAAMASNWKSSKGNPKSWLGSNGVAGLVLSVIVEPYG